MNVGCELDCVFEANRAVVGKFIDCWWLKGLLCVGWGISMVCIVLLSGLVTVTFLGTVWLATRGTMPTSVTKPALMASLM